MVKVSYLQIYNETVYDLIRGGRGNLQVREDRCGVFVEGLSEWVVNSATNIYYFMKQGAKYRATASTKLNDISSRSHAIFSITIEQRDGKKVKAAKLNLVDLAGSERLSIRGAGGKRLEECKKINRSLSALGNVIAALADNRTHIPYRDSKLTRLLKDSLGGNCKTVMLVMISPSIQSINESLSSLNFANRAKSVRNVLQVNEDKLETMHDIIQKLKDEKWQAEKEKAEVLNELRKEDNDLNEEVKNYKRLLLKQRDTMVALADKLKQRDEEIIQLHKELKGYKKLKHEVKLLKDFIKYNGLSYKDDIEDMNNELDNASKKVALEDVTNEVSDRQVEVQSNIKIPFNDGTRLALNRDNNQKDFKKRYIYNEGFTENAIGYLNGKQEKNAFACLYDTIE